MFAVAQFQQLTQACDNVDKVRLMKEVRAHNVVRGENVAVKLVVLDPLALSYLLPSSIRLGGEINGVTPIHTSIQQITQQSLRDGLHASELFGGTRLGKLTTTLAAGFSICCYMYVDRNAINQRIAREVLDQL